MENDDGLGLEPSAPPEHDFTVSALGLVTRTFKVWVRKLPSYIIIVGLIGVAYGLLQFAVFYALYGLTAFDLLIYVSSDIINTLLGIATAESVLAIEIITTAIVLTVVGMVVNAVIAGGGIKFALDDYGSHQADVGTSLSFAFSRLSTMIVAQFLLALIVAGALAPGMYLFLGAFVSIDPLNPSMEALSAMMMALPLLLIGAIVAFYFGIRLAPTNAVVVAEDLGAIDSMKRAWELTTGNFWHIFGGQILLSIAMAVIGLVLGMLVSPLIFYGQALMMFVSALIISLLFSAINYVFAAVLYRDLESRSRVTSQDYW
ncbi:MAG: glycerophosphoryl diester phosphodiesterase membrane domain-containing protein [Candidatus Thorarchaeota archaeon]